MDLFLDLPVELACWIVSKWLCFKDIVRLDTAFCHVEKRNILHESVIQSPFCSVDTNETVTRCAMLLHWTIANKVRVGSVGLDEFSRKFAKEFRGKRDTLCAPFDPKSLILQYSANTCLLCCISMNPGRHLFEFLGTCQRVELVEMKDVDKKVPNIPRTAATHHLHVSAIELNCSSALENAFPGLCVPESIQRARISEETIKFGNHHFPNLRSFGFSSCRSFIEDWAMVVECCPNVIHLDMGIHMDLRTADIASVVQRFHSLLSLNLEYCTLGPEAFYSGIFCHQHYLQALYMYQTEGCGADEINLVLKQCPLLRTFSYSARQGVVHSLMDSLTTLITDSTEFYALATHCHSVRELHWIRSYGSSDSISELFDLPSLGTLYLVQISIEEFNEVSAALQQRRPDVRVVQEEECGWYDLFSFPI